MRFLTVGNMYPPHHQGGYELVWQSGVRSLRQAGHEVRVLTTDHREVDVKTADEPDVHRELRWYWRDHDFPRLAWRQRLDLERHNASALNGHIDDLKPDAVGWWSMGGMSLSMIEQVRRRDIPAAGFVCDDWMLYGPHVDGWQRTFGRRLISGVAERVSGIASQIDLGDVGTWVFPSELVRSKAASELDLPLTQVVHQGVDHDLFRARPSSDWAWRLAYVGRLDPRKGLSLAIRALALLPDAASLEIVGGGDPAYLEELHEVAEVEGVAGRVTFTPQVARTELPDVYERSDAVLFPVLWEEPWGLVPLEAMAVGTPVVATGRGGSGEYLEDGQNCVTFNPDEGGPQALAAAVSRLADDERLREQLRESGFATTRKFSEGDFDRAVVAQLERAAESRRS